MVMKGCSSWHKQPLSTLSASIEHPLEPGGNPVEKSIKQRKSRFFVKIYFIERFWLKDLHISKKSCTFAAKSCKDNLTVLLHDVKPEVAQSVAR